MEPTAARRLVQLILSTPTGGALLEGLELEVAKHRGLDHRVRYIAAEQPAAAATAASVAAVREHAVGWLLSVALKSAVDIAGPWWDDAPSQLARALRSASARSAVAEAIVDCHGDSLTAPVDLGQQEWWTMNLPSPAGGLSGPLGSPRRPCNAWVTATQDAMWTTTTPSSEVPGLLLQAWELDYRPITRWRIQVDPAARVFEVKEPGDWQSLTVRYPLSRSRRPNSSWELPGPNQRDVSTVAVVPNQRALRTQMRSFVEPDWDAVAQDFDGVHLTWAGFITTEGTAIDLSEGDVAMMRNWNSERTLWLNPVLRDPRPLPRITPPHDGLGYEDWFIDPSSNPERLKRDLEWLSGALGS